MNGFLAFVGWAMYVLVVISAAAALWEGRWDAATAWLLAMVWIALMGKERKQ